MATASCSPATSGFAAAGSPPDGPLELPAFGSSVRECARGLAVARCLREFRRIFPARQTRAPFRVALCCTRPISVAGRHLDVRHAFGGFSGQVALEKEARFNLLYTAADDALGRSTWRQAYAYAGALIVRCCRRCTAGIRLRLQPTRPVR